MSKLIAWLKDLWDKIRGKDDGGSAGILSGSKRAVLTTGHDRFMTVTSALRAGTYNLNSGGCRVYNKRGKFITLPVSESVYDLHELPDGRVIASCEEANGVLYDGVSGTSLGGGHAHSILATRHILGSLVSVSAHWDAKDYRVKILGGSTYRLGHNGHRFFLRDIIEHNNRAIILGFDYTDEQGGFFRSQPGSLKNFKWVPVTGLKGLRPMKVVEYNNGLAITVSPYRNGSRTGPAGVVHYKNGKATMMHYTSNGAMGQGLVVRKGSLFYGTMAGWRTKGESHIYTNQGGSWKLLTTMPNAECWDLAVSNKGTIYAATGEEGGSGVVYEIGATHGGGKPPKPPKPTQGGSVYNKAENFPSNTGLLWKPTAEHRKVVVVLAPTSIASRDTVVRALDSNGNVIQTASWHNANGHNRGRMHYYFSAPGSAFAKFSPIVLQVGTRMYKVPNPASRYA